MIAPAHSINRLSPPYQARMVRVARAQSELTQPEPSKAEWIRQTVGRHPAAAVATACLVGLAIGWFVKRRNV
ncbi:hypothetical protein K227x_02070 [Rubripirellula lacrimiformis]|uniref:Uncharacterized protein n=1 Tax=Rubripirellula lacrimiformis TaxID=1930273 RepID=A0A517N4A9_9BACT|nr:hypothetical protein K227x_02070 [Rubripirellula lacrimiformis]